MDPDTVNWLDKVADWSWTVVLATAAVLGRAYMKVSRHEHQLKTLEAHHDERTRKLSEIERKIDTNQHIVLSAISKLGDETRADHRMVVSKLLDKVPHA